MNTSEERIPVATKFPAPVHTGQGTAQPPIQLVPGIVPGGKAAGAWRWTATHI
jgi:hypothetical protein